MKIGDKIKWVIPKTNHHKQRNSAFGPIFEVLGVPRSLWGEETILVKSVRFGNHIRNISTDEIELFQGSGGNND